jgi:integrase
MKPTDMKEEGRARGAGRVFKPRGCKFWYIQWYDFRTRATKSGRLTKRRTESSRSTSRSLAEQMLREYLGRKDRGETVLNPRKLTFASMEQLIKDDYAASANRSTRRLKTSLAHLRDEFGHDRAVDITSDRWLRYVAKRQQEGAAASSIRNERAALSRMFTLAMDAERIGSKPKLKTPPVENVRPLAAILDEEEIASILADERYPEDLKGAFEFGALTGWRIPSEVWPLQWSQVDRDEEVIRWEVGRTKNREGRTLHYGKLPALTALIERWWAKRRPPSPYVFQRGKRGRPIFSSRRRAYREWAAVCERLEIRGKDAYTVRHAMVMKLDRAGVPRSVARSITGHKTESMYLRYRAVRRYEQDEALAKIAK